MCLGEIGAGLGGSDPAHPSAERSRRHYLGLFARLPRTRTLTPDLQIWAEAGLIAGALARLRHLQPHQRRDMLNDALIYLTAAKAGLPVLTDDVTDFDLIQQLAPTGQFIHV